MKCLTKTESNMKTQVIKCDYAATAETGQIPLCMIGDSITWAEYGDCWRKELIRHLPNLAFIGSHSACFGYSHAGEGGNNTAKVLARMNEIPDCPNYNLLIGTNNNNVESEDKILPQAKATADDIIKIVNQLLAKNGAEKVFLSSLMPCYTDNPLRDKCNHETSKILRARFNEVFPENKVFWVEYEKPIRELPDWEKIILLHPIPEGYAEIAKITAKAISNVFGIAPGTKPCKSEKHGVQVINLMPEGKKSYCPVLPGWYTLSCKVNSVKGEKGLLKLRGEDSSKDTPLKIDFEIENGCTKFSENLFTETEGYGYRTDYLVLECVDCEVSEVLLEKMRPSKQASVYSANSNIDSISPFSNGELLEYSK